MTLLICNVVMNCQHCGWLCGLQVLMASPDDVSPWPEGQAAAVAAPAAVRPAGDLPLASATRRILAADCRYLWLCSHGCSKRGIQAVLAHECPLRTLASNTKLATLKVAGAAGGSSVEQAA